jgi:hypothetical protein
MDIDIIYAELGRLTRQVGDLEVRVDQAERDARNAKDDVYRLENRLRDLEYAR